MRSSKTDKSHGLSIGTELGRTAKEKKPSQNAKVTFPPTDRRKRGLLMSDAEAHRQLEQWEREDRARLDLLCAQRGITGEGSDKYYELCLSLARELYPESKKSGRKTKWTPVVRGVLVVEIERRIKTGDRERGISLAAKHLAMKEPWKSFVGRKESEDTSPNPAEVLRTEYHRFCTRPWAKISRKAFEFHEAANTLPAWEAFVDDLVRNPE